MSYGKRYFFTFNGIDTGNTSDQGDRFICEIYKKDYVGTADELQAQRNPVTISYNNSNKDKLLPLRASSVNLSLIADATFALADLYTEDDREWLIKVYRQNTLQIPVPLNVTWSLNETPGGTYVDLDLMIYVNGVLAVEQYINSSGSFAINKGDLIKIVAGSALAASPGIPGMQLEVTGKTILRRTVYPGYIEHEFTASTDLVIAAYSTHSASTYTAIRSEAFITNCSGTAGSSEIFTKTYTSATNQATADALATGDTGFTAEGQAYADLNGSCHAGSYLLWTGFILPELCEEEFTFTPYVLDAMGTCGLGILKNLSFVQESGLHFTGMMSFKDVIWNCLNRLQIPDMALNTAVNIYWDGLTPADATDPLAQTYTSTERFFKDEEYTPMTCEEVLKSVLEEWTACIVQMNGNWYVYRPNELALSGTVIFRQYSALTGAYTGTETLTLNKTLGGSSEGELIYHIDRNQRKSIARPFKNATISYKYGEMRNLDEQLTNSDLAGATKAGTGDPIGPRTDITIPGWTKTGTMNAGISAAGDVIFYPVSSPTVSNYYQNNTVFAIDNNFRLRLAIDYIKVDPLYYSPYMNFQIIWNDGLTNWYLQADYTWSSVMPYLNYFSINSEINTSGQLVITSEPTSSSGTITIRIMAPSNPERAIIYTNISAEVYQDQGIQVGDIYVATQTGKFTYVPEIINVFHGDSLLRQYAGAIYKNDQTTLTTLWNRRGLTESVLSTPDAVSKPFLRIAVEEILRLHQRPMSVYDGSIAGFFQYLTRFAINDLTGVFLPVQLTYNLQEGSIDATLSEVANDELANAYTLEPDYGSVTKVSINGI